MLAFVAVAGLFALSMVTASAHHSFAATYDEEHTQKVEGDLVQFMFRNPHSFVQLDAKDEKGVVQRWLVEWGGGNVLNNTGVNRDTLRPGDHVIVTGKPGREAADHRLRLTSIERPKDGWKWSGTFD